MTKTKLAILLGSPAISGGTYVIFEHAIRNKDDDVYIVTEKPVTKKDISWHKEARRLKFITYEKAARMNFDVAIATWWRTVYELHRINAKKYIYFVQSIESKFYDENSDKFIKWLAESTYLLPLDIITEAKWIKDYLEQKYNLDVKLVLNGIRKDIYTNEGEKYFKNEGLRVLVEGPVDVGFKNVPRTIELVKKSDADELWLLTSSNIENYEGVDRVFSRVPIVDVAKIYRSCDVIVKLSYVEGMFGPPLEMFHCGGTAIVYDVTGHDEYIKNQYNGIVIKTDCEQDVIDAINKLKIDKKSLSRLKKNALKTANKWVEWEESANNFKNAVHEILNDSKKGLSQNQLKIKSNHIFEGYTLYEKKPVALKREIRKRLKQKISKIYHIFFK